jgi:hypothetical protein
MTRLKLLGAATVLLSSALASPVMAQQVITNPGYCAQFYPNANCQNNGPNSPYTGDYQRRTAYQSNENAPYKYGKGDWSDSSGAIATAPSRSDAYAYYGGRGDWRPGEYNLFSDNYAVRNGIVCQPGAWIKGEDGRRHICQ